MRASYPIHLILDAVRPKSVTQQPSTPLRIEKSEGLTFNEAVSLVLRLLQSAIFAVPQVSIRKLKEIHTLTHPAKITRSP